MSVIGDGIMSRRKLVSFDWAMKKLLRSKANYEILEGFLSELLKEDIKILEILESESNKEDNEDKFNRVDLKVKDSKGEIIIIEVQYGREYDYFQRILFGSSKTITEHMREGNIYLDVVKVISINILYFDLGHGKDYIYHGTTNFRGLHEKDELELNEKQKELFKKEKIEDLFPEYYLLKVNNFNDIAKDTLDEWIYFLKNGEIKEKFKAKGIKKAEKELNVMKLSEEERIIYEKHIDNIRYQGSMIWGSYASGEIDGMKKGIEKGIKEGIKKGKLEGIKEGKLETAKNLLKLNVSKEVISQSTGLSIEEIEGISE